MADETYSPMHDPNATSDALHSQIKTLLAKKPGNDALDNKFEAPDYKLALAHPAITPETIKDIYHGAMPTQPNAAPGEELPDYGDIAKEAMKHPQAPASIAEDYMSRTYNNTDSDSKQIFDLASRVPGVSQEFKTQIANKIINEGKHEGYRRPPTVKGLDPEAAMQMLKDLPNHPNKDNVGTYVHELVAQAAHNPKTLQEAVDFYTQHQPGHGNDMFDAGQEELASRNDLTPDQVSKLYAVGSASAKSKLLQHEHIDPSTVAAVASNEKDPDGLRNDALQSHALPAEVRKALIEKGSGGNHYDNPLRQMLLNKDLPADEVHAIASKGLTDALYHPNTSPETVKTYWGNSDKKTDAARAVLKSPNVPHDLLKELVGHENQDVAIKAINHPSSDMNIVQAGLKRKAKAVQDAATKHPLVANNLVKSRLISGQMSGTKLFTDEDVGKIYSNLPEEGRQQVDAALDKRYSYKQPDIGAEFPGIHSLSLNLGVSPEDFFKVKTHLAENADPVIANRHKTDLINDFYSKFGPNQVPEEDDSKTIRPSYYINKANSGDPAFQDLALKSNGLLTKLDLANGDYSGDFLRKVHEKLQQGPLAISYHGGEAVRDGNEDRRIISKLVKNPALPQDVFGYLITNPYQLQIIAKEDLGREGHAGNRITVEPGKENTFFDKRYAKMDPVQRRQNFMYVRDQNTPESNEYILRSSTAPEDMWKEAWNRLSVPDRKRVLDRSTVERLAPPDVKRNILDGAWDRIESYRSPKNELLSSLSPDKPEDVKLFNDWYKDQVEVRGVGSNNFRPDLIKVNPRFYSTPIGHELVQQALVEDPLHGSSPAVAKAAADAGISSEDNIYQYKLNAKQLLSNIQNEFSSLPDDSKLIAWYGAVSRNHDKFSEISKSADSHGNQGVFDFLADLPGDPDQKNALMGKVLGLGLLSKEKRDQVAYDPNSFSAALKNAEEHQTKSLIRGYLDSDAPKTIGNMETLSRRLNPRTFYPHNQIKRTAMDQSDLENYGHYIKKFLEAAETTGLSNTLIIKGLSTAAWAHDGAEKDKLAVGGKIIEAVNGMAKTPTETKNHLLLRIAADNSSASVSKVFDAAVAKNIIDTNDIASALKMADDWVTPPATILRFLAKAAKNPKALDDTSLSHLLSQLESRSTAVGVSKSLTKAAFDRIDARDAEKSEIAGNLKAVLLGNLSRAVSSSQASPENATHCYESLVKFGVKYGQSPEYHEALLGAASSPSQLPAELKAKAFASLPYDLPAGYDRAVDASVFASPEAIEAATGGWKLQAAMLLPQGMSKDGVSVIANRAIENPILMNSEGEHFAARLMRNTNADDSDITKVVRATGRQGIEHLFRENMSFGYADSPAERSHLLFGPMVDVTAGRMHESEIKPIDQADGDIPINLQLIFNAAKKFKRGKEGDAEAMAAVHKSIDLLDRHLDWLKPHVEKDPELDNIPTANQANLTSKAAAQLGQIVGIDDPEYSLKALDIYDKAWKTCGKTVPNRGFAPDTYVANWVSNQSDSLSTGQWSSVFASHPEVVGGIGHRKVVDTDILDAFPWDQYKNVGGAAIEATAFSTWANKMSDAAKEKYAERMFDSVSGMKDVSHDDVATIEGLIRGFGTHITKKTLDRNLSGIENDKWDHLQCVALESGAGGKELLNENAEDCFDKGQIVSDRLTKLQSVLRSPFIDADICDKFLNSFDISREKDIANPAVTSFAYGDLLKDFFNNPYLPAQPCPLY